MKTRKNLKIPKKQLEEFCQKNHIIKLSLFGSALRDDFGPDSDVDMLVEFGSEARFGLIGFAGLELELSEMLGRKVDLNTPESVNKYYREKVLAEAEVQYDSA